MKFFGAVGQEPRTNRFDFGGDPSRDPDPEIFLLSHMADKSVEDISSLIRSIITCQQKCLLASNCYCGLEIRSTFLVMPQCFGDVDLIVSRQNSSSCLVFSMPNC